MILKDDVGQAKATTRDLPSFEHTYGKFVLKDPIGVQQRKPCSNA